MPRAAVPFLLSLAACCTARAALNERAVPPSPRHDTRSATAGMAAMRPAPALSDEIDIHAPDAAPGVLLLPGRKFPLSFETGEFFIQDASLRIREVQNAGSGTGLTVWDGSVVLAKYLERANFYLGDKRVLELGAGTGLVGLAASYLGAHSVYITDLHYTLDNARVNAAKNAHNCRGEVVVTELDWEKPDASAVPLATVDLLLAADVVWVPDLIRPLVNATAHILRAAGTTRPSSDDYPLPRPALILSHQTRSHASDALLWAEMKAAGLSVRLRVLSSLTTKNI